MSISVLIPVYNEEEILERCALQVHEYLTERSIEHELVVTSNGSTDDTDKIGMALSQKYTWFRFFTLPEKGVGKAFSNGVKQAKFEYLVSLDADLSFEMRFLDYANHLLAYGDMVVGSKTMGKQRRSPLRVIASQSYILFAQLLLNLTTSDYSIGCKAYKRSSIIEVVDKIDPWTGYVIELALHLTKRGKKVLQIGVECDDRRASHFNLWHEGVYRYGHLFRLWRRTKNVNDWL